MLHGDERVQRPDDAMGAGWRAFPFCGAVSHDDGVMSRDDRAEHADDQVTAGDERIEYVEAGMQRVEERRTRYSRPAARAGGRHGAIHVHCHLETGIVGAGAPATAPMRMRKGGRKAPDCETNRM